MRPWEPIGGYCNQAELYALGCLSAEEAFAYESHLTFCETCRDDVAAHGRTAEELARTAPEIAPPAALKDRLMRLLCARPVLQREAEGVWEPTGLAGVDVRRLFADAASDRQTMLVRMRPCSTYPTHRHGGIEECYVIAGDLLDGTVRMTAGDYIRYSDGSHHGPLSTEKGCLLLVQTSLHDEMMGQP